jgi:integrase
MVHRDLKDRTWEHYRKLLEQHILPPLGALPIASITSEDVRRWHASLGAKTPTLRAHCYQVLHTIMGTAASDGKISVNPCVIRGAGSARRVHKVPPATLAEVEVITAAMPEPYQAMVLLASWCSLRFGELTELHRGDVDLTEGVIRVCRAVVRAGGGFQVTTPKSDAGGEGCGDTATHVACHRSAPIETRWPRG